MSHVINDALKLLILKFTISHSKLFHTDTTLSVKKCFRTFNIHIYVHIRRGSWSYRRRYYTL